MPSILSAANRLPTAQAGITLIVVCSTWLFGDAELEHPKLIWIKFGELHEAIFNGSDILDDLLSAGDIEQVFLSLPEVTEERYNQILHYFQTYALTKVYKVRSDTSIKKWVKTIPKEQEMPNETPAAASPVREIDQARVMVLGVNLSAVPNTVNDPLYLCYNHREAEKLTEVPPQIRITVALTNNVNPGVILRMKDSARSAGSKFIELAGGTAEFKNWLARTDVKKELVQIMANDTQEVAWKPFKRGERVSLVRNLLDRYRNGDGVINFDGIHEEIKLVAGPNYPKHQVYSIVRRVIRGNGVPHTSVQTSPIPKAETTHLAETPAANQCESALDLLAAAEAKFQEGLRLVEKAKAKVLADAERMKVILPLEQALRAYANLSK